MNGTEEQIIPEDERLPVDRLLEEEEPIEPELEKTLDYPETPAVDPTHDYQATNKAFVDALEVTLKAYADTVETDANAYTDTKQLVGPSDTLQLSDDTERSYYAPWDVWEKVTGAEITSTVDGKIKAKFDMKKNDVDAYPTYGRIYVNDVAIGDIHEETDTSYTTYTDTDIDIAIGDVVSIYVTGDLDNSQSNTIWIENFRLYWTVSTKTYIDAADDLRVGTFKLGTTTFQMDSVSHEVEISHGLGSTPMFVRITGAYRRANNSAIWARSVGAYNGTTTSCVYETDDTAGSSGAATTDDANVIHLVDGSAGGQSATMVITATKLILGWTKASNPGSADAAILWEAWGT